MRKYLILALVPVIAVALAVPVLSGATVTSGDNSKASEKKASAAATKRGPRGKAGKRGKTGPRGATGATGATGAAGATGATGATGAVGPQGVPGAQGPQGPAGNAGSLSIQYVESGNFPNPVGAQSDAIANCPAGMKAIGGGFSASSNVLPGQSVNGSFATPDGGGWHVYVDNNGTTPQTVKAFAVCATVGSVSGP